MSYPTSETSSRIDRLLDTNGDGTGTKNANVDGSSTPQLFKIGSEEGRNLNLARMVVSIRDTGTFTASDYGAAAALTNGIQVGIFDSNGDIVDDFLDGLNIKENSQWGRACYDVDLKTWGNGPSMLLVRWTFTRAGGFVYIPEGSTNTFGIKVQDNLTVLEEHYFFIEGFWS